MGYQVEITADSIDSITGKRITTFFLTYPRIIHAELMTHRQFSRNTSSSRAIPVDKMIQNVIDNPFVPDVIGHNTRGMSAKVYLQGDELIEAQNVWQEACRASVETARQLQALGAHKQTINRVLEPYSYITALVTSTEFANFFWQRVSVHAQPEIAFLAYMMLKEYRSHTPKVKVIGEWHLAMGTKHLNPEAPIEQNLKICTARAARTSYMNFYGMFDDASDKILHDGLREEHHMSPFEHCAMATGTLEPYGNFIGWKQYRKFIPNEVYEDENYDVLIKEYQDALQNR